MAMIAEMAMCPLTRLTIRFLIVVALWTVAAKSNCLTLVTWNIASDHAEIETVLARLRELNVVDFYGLTEVAPKWAPVIESYLAASGTPFDLIISDAGRNDRLAVAYNTNKYELVTRFTLDEVNIGQRVRPALVGLFREKATSTEFYFMVNHLYRSDKEARLIQSELLNTWVQKSKLPTIAVGDYNYDLDASNGIHKYNSGYERLTAYDVLRWVVPFQLIKTQCGRYNTILDFVFVSKHFNLLEQHSKVELADPSYCELRKPGDSDHRPVFAEIRFSET